MTYWYVDFENVHSEADLGMLLNQAKRGDTIIIYYSAVCPMFPLKQIQNLAHRGDKAPCRGVCGGYQGRR